MTNQEADNIEIQNDINPDKLNKRFMKLEDELSF